MADTDFETAVPTAVTVSWVSNGTWASTGSRGENNNLLTGNDKALTIGYLDTGNATTTSVTITNVPAALTSLGYDVYVYAIRRCRWPRRCLPHPRRSYKGSPYGLCSRGG